MGLPYNIPDWQAAAAEKRQGLHASIPKSYLLPADLSSKVQRDEVLPSDESVLSCGVLTPLDLEITSIDDAAVLVDSIAFRRYTAVQVTEAFCRRASTAQQTTNCLTEILYGSALERARSLDEYMEKEGRPVGMLHGLPVSLKVRCFPSLFPWYQKQILWGQGVVCPDTQKEPTIARFSRSKIQSSQFQQRDHCTHLAKTYN